jgi:hypothetical protein
MIALCGVYCNPNIFELTNFEAPTATRDCPFSIENIYFCCCILIQLFLSGLNALPFNDDALIGYRSKEAKLFQMVINQNYDKEQRPPGIENVGENIRTLENGNHRCIQGAENMGPQWHFCSKSIDPRDFGKIISPHFPDFSTMFFHDGDFRNCF